MTLTHAQAEKATILKVLVGSHVHGLNIETSDRDIEAIVIEPMEYAMGLGRPFEETVIQKGEPCETSPIMGRVCQKGLSGCVVQHADVSYVSLRKWARLAINGNPNFLLPLFAPNKDVLSGDARGFGLRAMAPKFISRQAIRSHLGYMQNQRKRMLRNDGNGGHGKPRIDLVEKYGYDTKFAMHLLRLGLQGIELMREGKVSLPIKHRDRAFLLGVREGKHTIDEVIKISEELERQLKAECDTCDLPEKPQTDEVQKAIVLLYIRQWSAARTLDDVIHDRERWGLTDIIDTRVEVK